MTIGGSFKAAWAAVTGWRAKKTTTTTDGTMVVKACPPCPTDPVKPGATTPVKPGATAPVKPGPTTPVKPGATTPVKPGATTPAPTAGYKNAGYFVNW